MKAALVTSYGTAPRYVDVPEPQLRHEHEILVDVLAAGLHPRVRMHAAGAHYTSAPGDLPLVPGMDAVGRGPDGRLWYFMSFGGPDGTMAERAVVDTRRAYVLPDGSDPVTVAATVNCVIASWLALRQRIVAQPGQHVLVLGATGGTGRMAVQVAAMHGAARVTAVGRDRDRLAAVAGATTTALIGEPLSPDVDVVLDLLWGDPATTTMDALVAARIDPGRPLTWINLGEMAGPRAELPAGLLRSQRIEVIGSGQGSLTGRQTVAEAPAVLAEIARGTFVVDAAPVPLSEAERVWSLPEDSSRRIVLVP